MGGSKRYEARELYIEEEKLAHSCLMDVLEWMNIRL